MGRGFDLPYSSPYATGTSKALTALAMRPLVRASGSCLQRNRNAGASAEREDRGIETFGEGRGVACSPAPNLFPSKQSVVAGLVRELRQYPYGIEEMVTSGMYCAKVDTIVDTI